MTQQIKALARKHDSLSSILGNHTVEGDNWFLQAVFLQKCVMGFASTHKYLKAYKPLLSKKSSEIYDQNIWKKGPTKGANEDFCKNIK